MGEQVSPTSPSDGDFVVSSSGFTPEPVPTASLTPAADAAPAADPPPVSEPEPAAEPAEPVAAEGAEPASDPVAAAAAKLPSGDSKAGRTLSERGRVIQAEIHQLTYQKHQTKLEMDAARAELAQLQLERERIAQEVATRHAPPAAVEPEAKDFDTFEEFSRALGKFYRDEAKREAVAESETRLQQILAEERERTQAFHQQQQLTQVYAQHQQNIDAARAAHADFDEVVAGSALPTNPMMETHIPRSPVSGELLHYLATHPDECHRIAQLDAGPTLVALGRLEARIEGVKSGPPSARPPVVSKAQRPIKPVGASSGIADEVPDANVPLDEHVAYWNRKERETRAGRR